MRKIFLAILSVFLIFSLGFSSDTEVYYGVSSWYGSEFAGRLTASGQVYNPQAMTAAHPSLPFGTKIEVENLENSRKCEVTVNDRGPFVEGRILDLSKKAADVLGFTDQGTAYVKITVLSIGDGSFKKSNPDPVPSVDNQDTAQSVRSAPAVKPESFEDLFVVDEPEDVIIQNPERKPDTDDVELPERYVFYPPVSIDELSEDNQYQEEKAKEQAVKENQRARSEYEEQQQSSAMTSEQRTVKRIVQVTNLVQTITNYINIPVGSEVRYQNVDRPVQTERNRPKAAEPEKYKVRETVPEPEKMDVEEQPAPGVYIQEETRNTVKGNGTFYAVQVGAFADQNNAYRIYDMLRAKGYNVFTKESVRSDGKVLLRVRIGYYETQAVAEKTVQKMKEEFMLEAIIIKIER